MQPVDRSRLAGLLRPLAIACAALSGTAAAVTPALLPQPERVVAENGSLLVRAGDHISAGDAAGRSAATLLARRMTASGLKLSVVGAGDAVIAMRRDPSVAGAEAYRLRVSPKGIEITASGDSGLLYGAMTLAQLLDDGGTQGTTRRIRAMTIEDRPRFTWRGLMLDPARHFVPLDTIRSVIDQMAALKLNMLHLHLTDDQGWRFEVKRYPRLTEIGAWRIARSSGNPVPAAPAGGFYTQAELKALVHYAADRGVTIVPEIDVPGHVTALVAAYPEHGVTGSAPAVGRDWGVRPWLLNPRPETVAFVKNVLDEVMAVFPGPYIHIGGDEAIKDQWIRSGEVQRRIKDLGLKDENALQAWLIGQFATHLSERGRRLIGWDEILEGGLPPAATVMSWRGEAGAIAAANAGHDVVMSPVPLLYFDFLQSDRDDEPPGRRQVVTVEDVYRYDPLPAGVAADRRRHVIGVQGSAWGELISAPRHLEHMLFPRTAALAEVAWSSAGPDARTTFYPRLHAQMRRWRAQGIAVADSAFAVSFASAGSINESLRGKPLSMTLATPSRHGTIRYTLDGSAPTTGSPAYAAPIIVPPGVAVTAAAFDSGGRATARPRRFETTRAALLTRTGTQLAPCPGEKFQSRVAFDPDATDDGPAYDLNLFNGCSVYPAAPLDIARGFRIDVARIPRSFSLAQEGFLSKPQFAVTDHGELLVRIGCGPTYPPPTAPAAPRPVAIADFPLPDPATAPRRFTFEGVLPAGRGDADLCLQFTADANGPAYVVERVRLLERPPGKPSARN